MKKTILFIIVFIFMNLNSIYSYELIGEYTIGDNSPNFHVYKSTESMDAYRLMSDEIKSALNAGFIIISITPHVEMPNIGRDLINLFNRSRGDLLSTVVFGVNGPELYIYFSSNGRYYLYTVMFWSNR